MTRLFTGFQAGIRFEMLWTRAVLHMIGRSGGMARTPDDADSGGTRHRRLQPSTARFQSLRDLSHGLAAGP